MDKDRNSTQVKIYVINPKIIEYTRKIIGIK